METYQWQQLKKFEEEKIDLLERILATLKEIQFRDADRDPHWSDSIPE